MSKPDLTFKMVEASGLFQLIFLLAVSLVPYYIFSFDQTPHTKLGVGGGSSLKYVCISYL